MKDIFDLLNHIKTDFEKYEILELSPSEKEKSADRILCKLKQRDAQNNRGVNLKLAPFMDQKKFVGAAALFLICLLSVGGVAYAMTDGFKALFTFIGGSAVYETTESGIMGTTSTTTIELKDEPGIPLLLEGNRLYFTGDGGRTDITDFISETEPYFIDVIDEERNTHKFIIGGMPEEESYGYEEIIIDTEGIIRGGVGSFGSKIDMIEGTPEWLKKGRSVAYSEVFGTDVDLW